MREYSPGSPCECCPYRFGTYPYKCQRSVDGKTVTGCDTWNNFFVKSWNNINKQGAIAIRRKGKILL